MAPPPLDPTAFPLKIAGDLQGLNLLPVAARVHERISAVPGFTVEFVTANKTLDLGAIVGKWAELTIDEPEGTRVFSGSVISAEYLRQVAGYAVFTAEVRSWLWFLTRRTEVRIFQQKTVIEIITDVLDPYGFTANLDNSTTHAFEAREYCVQYRETDLDFISRLMEEEGIYYFFTYGGGTEKMVLADAPSAHPAIPGGALPYLARSGSLIGDPHVFDWTSGQQVRSGKVTLEDYNFETPRADLASVSQIPSGEHGHTTYERYDYPGHYRASVLGDHYAKVRMEAEAIGHKIVTGAANTTTIGTGLSFMLIDAPRRDDPADVVVIQATHHLQLAPDFLEKTFGAVDSFGHRQRLGFDADVDDPAYVTFKAVPADQQYRAPLVTPWPKVGGVHTAVVTGPSGEEIHTDPYGRIKVKFHWDRAPAADDTTTCWVRTMMPWTGKNWGAIAVPRIGQEVVIQFEEGDPDRPICIGMLYNADTMPPYALPANKTQSGVKTNSSLGGGGFNELMFEDKAGEELVRFQAERDYEQIVKNDAEITVGQGHQDKGDMSLTVHRHLTETVETGDHTFTVATGSQIVDIKTDQTETIEGKRTQQVTGNVAVTVKQGNVTETVDTGNVSEEIKMGNLKVELGMGNETRELKLGNYSLKAALGKIAEEAMQSIELKVGANSIKIDQSGITIKGLMVRIEGTAMLEAKAPMSQIKGDGLLILKGGLTTIN